MKKKHVVPPAIALALLLAGCSALDVVFVLDPEPLLQAGVDPADYEP